MFTKSILKLMIPFIALSGCSEGSVEEFTFRKLLESDLKDECGKNTECKELVSLQIKNCMELANWKNLLDKEEGDKAFEEFDTAFNPCFKDKSGKPLF